MEPVPLWKVKDMLTDVSSERPLPREATFSLQHAEAAMKCEPTVSRALYKKLKELPFLTESLAAKIVDIMPETPEEVWLLLPKDRLPLDETQVHQVMDVLAEHR
jgi:DNA-directed RNA polymerase subunit F